MGNKREQRSKTWSLSFGKGLAKHLCTSQSLHVVPAAWFPGHKTVASDNLPVPAADSGHTNINSSIPPLKCCILPHHVHFTHSFSEPCCRYKLSLPGSLFSTTEYLSGSRRLPMRPAKAVSARGGHVAMTGSGSSMGRRFSSEGGQLRNSSCVMTGSCLKYPGGLRLPLFIPLTLTLTSFLPTSELTQSSPISCSSFHHRAPTPACCSAGLPCWVTAQFLLLCMARTWASHTFLSSFPPALSRLEGTN